MAIINKYITFVSLNSLVGLSPLCQASALDAASKQALTFELPSERVPASDQDLSQEDSASESEDANVPEDDAVSAIEAWKSVEEMEADVERYRDLGFSPKYIKSIKGRIEATANVQVKDPQSIIVPEERERIDDAICMLWECKNNLGNVSGSLLANINGINMRAYTLESKIKNKHPIVRAATILMEKNEEIEGLIKVRKEIDNLINTINKKMNNLAINVYREESKDFKDLALFMAFFHTNIKKYNAFFNFGAAVESALALYERTEDTRIQKIIEDELQEIKDDGDSGTFGPYGDKIKEFSKSLRSILTK